MSYFMLWMKRRLSTPLTASKSGDVSGSCSQLATSCSATTTSVTVTPVGGTAPYTYAWSYVSGTTATVTSPTAASTTFSRSASSSTGAGSSYNGVYRCTVTDSLSNTATVDVTVTTTHIDTYVALSASANFTTFSGSCSTNNGYGCTATTGSAVVTAQNGQAPYTYAWNYVSGTSATVNSPTSNTTTFSRNLSGSSGGTVYTGYYTCTVTDARSNTYTTVNLTVSTTHTDTYVALSASKSGDASGTCSHTISGSCSVTTNSVTVTASNGLAPYTYAWSFVSGITATVNSPSAATTTFTRSGTGQTINGTYRCTVTDSTGRYTTVDVTVSTTHNYNAPALSVYYVPSSGQWGTGYQVNWSSSDATAGVYYSITGAVTASGTLSPVSAGSAQGVIDWIGTAYGTFWCTGPGGTAYSYSNITGTTPPALSAGANSYSASGLCVDSSLNGCTAWTGTIVITASNGYPPYSYSWSSLYGSGISVSGGGSSVQFYAFGYANDYKSDTFRCTVTDSHSNSTYVDISVGLEFLE